MCGHGQNTGVITRIVMKELPIILYGSLEFIKIYYLTIFLFLLFVSVPLSSSFILREAFYNPDRCSSTKLPDLTDQFPFGR